MKEKIEINDGHYTELLDRLYVVMENINSHIVDHPLTKTDIRIESLVDKAVECLYHAYQLVGEKDHERHLPKE